MTRKKNPEDWLPTGRPSMFTEELGDRIVQLYANGKRLVEICRENEWAPEAPHTIRRWADRIPGFGRKLAEARRYHAEAMAEEIVDDAINTIDPQRARAKIQAKQWLASKYNPQTFGDKLELAVDHRVSLTDAMAAAQERLRSMRDQQPGQVGQVIDITPQIEDGTPDSQSDDPADEADLPDFMR